MTQEKPDQSLDEPWGHDGVTHLHELGRAPRAAGSAEEREAREYGAAVLRNLGFDVTLESFSYSTFPGRYGTPVGGAIAAASVLLTFWLVIIEGAVVAGSIAFGAGLLLLVLFVWSMLGDGVLEVHRLTHQGTFDVAGQAGVPLQQQPCVSPARLPLHRSAEGRYQLLSGIAQPRHRFRAPVDSPHRA